jgi:Family of unknown function (DUF6200)
MATASSAPSASASTHEHRESEKSTRSHVIVDLGEAQPSAQIRRLRKGKGKLFHHVENIIDDLIAAGTVKSNTQPVVIIVRELPSFWPFEDHDE